MRRRFGRVKRLDYQCGNEIARAFPLPSGIG